MKDSDAVSAANGLDLRNDAAAFIASRHESAEHRRIVQCPAVDEILDLGDEQAAGKIGLRLDGTLARQISISSIDTERVVGELGQDQLALLGPVQRDRNVSLAP